MTDKLSTDPPVGRDSVEADDDGSNRPSVPEWGELTETVLERDGKQCVNCGSRNRLEVHHIAPVSADGNTVSRTSLRRANPVTWGLKTNENGTIKMYSKVKNAISTCRLRTKFDRFFTRRAIR